MVPNHSQEEQRFSKEEIRQSIPDIVYTDWKLQFHMPLHKKYQKETQ